MLEINELLLWGLSLVWEVIFAPPKNLVSWLLYRKICSAITIRCTSLVPS